MKIKRFLNRFGYDVKKYRSTIDTTIRPLGIQTIIDIGANMGHYARDMRKLFPEAQIYSFEPLSDCFKSLENEMRGDARFKAFNTALGESKGEATINRSSFHPSSSLLPMSAIHKKLYPKSANSVSEKIRIERLDDVLKNEALAPGILIKMDVQGFEDKVIGGAKETLGRADVAVIETSYVPLYENQPLFDDIYMLMRGLGFSYYGDMARHYSKENDRLVYEDSIFIKKKSIKI